MLNDTASYFNNVKSELYGVKNGEKRIAKLESTEYHFFRVNSFHYSYSIF